MISHQFLYRCFLLLVFLLTLLENLMSINALQGAVTVWCTHLVCQQGWPPLHQFESGKLNHLGVGEEEDLFTDLGGGYFSANQNCKI